MSSKVTAVPAVKRWPAWLPMVFAAFAVLGFVSGGWQVVLADLQRALALTDGALGAALTLGALGSLPAMWLGGRAADRWGARPLMAVAGVLLVAALLAVATLRQGWLLAPIMFVYFAGFGGYDVGINTAAIRLEQIGGWRFMPYAHAAFSLGSATGAASAGLLLVGQVPFRLILGGLGLVVAGFIALVALRREGAPPPVPATAPGPTLATRGLFALALLWPIALIAMASAVAEGTLENWTSIYLRSYLTLPVALGAAGVLVFQSAMFTGRLAAGRLLARLSRRTFIGLAGLLITVGMALALATTRAPLVLAGFLLVGLALAGLIPTAFSLAGDAAPEHAGRALSTVTLVGYVGFLGAPLLIGTLADHFGLRAALAILLAVGVIIAGLSRFLQPRRA
jgi:MFS family permease